MKRLPGMPDFADHDELDLDALDAMDEYNQGILSFDELKDLVGQETAQSIRVLANPDHDPNSYFDDPENY